MTNSTVYTNNPESTVPILTLSPYPRGVSYDDSIFACDPNGDCKCYAIGHSQWTDVEGFQGTRLHMGMAVVNGKIMIAGGKNASGKEY